MSTNTPFVRTYFQMVVTRPWTIIALSALVLFASAAFLPSMVMDTRSDAFIDAAEPSLVYREKVEELFGLADPIVIAVTNDSSAGIYNPDSLMLVQWLTEQVQQLSNVDPERVVSLATEANIVGTDDGMEIEDFFDESPSSPARVIWIKQAVENFPLFKERDLRTYEGHKLADGSVHVLGFLTAAEKQTADEASGTGTIHLFAEPKDNATELVCIPMKRVKRSVEHSQRGNKGLEIELG